MPIKMCHYKLFIVSMIIFLFLFQGIGYAGKIPIEIIDKTEDIVAKRLLYNVKETIRKSNGFTLSNKGVILILIINSIGSGSLPFGKIPSGLGTVFYTTLCISLDPTWPRGNYVDSSIGYCGDLKIHDMAETIISEVDSWVSRNKLDILRKE